MKANAIRYSVASAVGLVLAFIVMWAQGIFKAETTTEIFRILSDAFFVSGVVFVGVGVILFSTNNGLFDMLAFGIRTLFTKYKRDVTNRKYKDFYEYRQAQAGKKRSSAYLLVVGVCLVAIGGIMLLCYYKV